MIDFDAHRDLFDWLEQQPDVQAELSRARNVEEMRAVLEVSSGAALPLFEGLVAELHQQHGDESRFAGKLHAALTSVSHGDIYTRFAPETDSWVWAESRDAEPGDWSSFDDAQAQEMSAAGLSLQEEAVAAYQLVLQELGELAPEDQSVVWGQVCRRVEDEQAAWTAHSAGSISQEVITAYREAEARAEEDVTAAVADLVAALDSFERTVSEHTAL